MEMDYLTAETILADAADTAWEEKDFDTLWRVYLPLQEARRQRRQRAGEGVVCLDLIATGPEEGLDPERIAREIPHGQLLVAGFQSLAPSLELRRIQSERALYLDTFLAAAYPSQSGLVVTIYPLPDSTEHCLTLPIGELPHGRVPGTAKTYGQVMDLWERLHAPFLATADSEKDPISRIQAYRLAIEVDYACEFAHQRLSNAAKELSRDLLK
jgi:hypothetical protein